MAGVKISALPAITTPTLADEFAAVQSGVTYKVTLGQAMDVINDKPRVRVATTAALTATYSNGTSGVGRTLTNSGALAALTIDAIALNLNDRVLVKNQAAAAQNGIYYVSVVGDGATAWVLTGATDADTAGEIEQGNFYTVGVGTVNAKTQWIQTNVITTVGTDPIAYESNVVAGTGITKTTNTVSLTDPVTLTLGGTNNTSMVADDGAIVYSDASKLTLLAATATAGQMMRSGSNTAPTWSTATYAATYGASELLFNNGANTVEGLATANSALLSTDSSGVPAWTASLTNGQLLIGDTGNTPAVTTLTAGTGISIANGAGSITISAGGSGYSWTEVTGTSQAMAVNNGYIANNAGLVTCTLPATAALGDSVTVQGKGAGLFKIAQNAGQTVHFSGSSTTTGVGGSLTAIAQFDSIEILCITANTDWAVSDSVGNFTIV